MKSFLLVVTLTASLASTTSAYQHPLLQQEQARRSTTTTTSSLRRLEEEENNEDNQGIYDLALLSIQYLGCSSFLSATNYGNENNENQQGYYQDGVYMTETNLVRFQLCNTTTASSSSSASSSTCSSNNNDNDNCSGEYALDMLEFLEIYAEVQQQQKQQQCAYVAQHCYCSSGYWDQCLYQCYANAGITECLDYSNNGGENNNGGGFQLQEYIDCRGA